MKQPSAVLFDLDDTILATDANADACWLECCERAAAVDPAVNASVLFREIQAQRAWYWSDFNRHRTGRLNLSLAREEIAAQALIRTGVRSPALAPLIASTYHALSRERISPFPRALDTLHWFRERGVPLGLITNGASEMQRWKIDRFQLANLFGVIVVEEEFGVGKPDLAVFEHALRALRVSARETWMVGDRLDWDVGPPQQIGIQGVWNDFRKAGLPKDSTVIPSRIVHAIFELTSG
jgi:putative hydrolase of the HAD superfamily